MHISADTRIPFPRSLVYTTYRDKLAKLVPYTSGVRHFEVKSRCEQHGLVYCVNEWHGGGEIPGIARTVLSEDMLCWTEYDTWDESQFTLDWQVKTHAFTQAVSCVGNNHFLEEGSTTLIKNRGELTIDPKQIEGLPKFLAGRIVSAIEDWLGKKIETNLLEMSDGVRRYLEREAENN